MTAVLPLLGLVTVLKARAKRKRGQPEPANEDFEKRQAATLESERRMAAYLASRDSRE